MPLPRRRHGPSRKGRSRSHKNLVAKTYSVCPHCKEPKQSHQICPSCGFYKERAMVVKVSS